MIQYKLTNKGLKEVLFYIGNRQYKPAFVEAMIDVYANNESDLLKRKLPMLLEFGYVFRIGLN